MDIDIGLPKGLVSAVEQELQSWSTVLHRCWSKVDAPMQWTSTLSSQRVLSPMLSKSFCPGAQCWTGALRFWHDQTLPGVIRTCQAASAQCRVYVDNELLWMCPGCRRRECSDPTGLEAVTFAICCQHAYKLYHNVTCIIMCDAIQHARQ